MHDGRIIRYVKENKSLKTVKFHDTLDEKVFLLKLTPGISSYILEAIFSYYDCIIIESFGSGGIPESLEAKLFELMQQYPPEEKIVIMTTQVTYEGSNVGVYEVGQKLKSQFKILEAKDMTLEAVIAKTMWILGKTKDRKEFREIFYTTVNHDLLFLPE